MTAYAVLPLIAVLTVVFALGLPLARSYLRDGTVALMRPHDSVQGFLHAAFAGTMVGYGGLTLLISWRPDVLDVHPGPPWLSVAGLGLGLGALALVVVAQAQMGRSWRIGIDKAPTVLITHGVFRWTRNPIYLGMLLLVVGVALVAPSGWTVMGVLLVYVEVGFQARSEEQHLASQHGDAFLEWAGRAGRFVPGIGRLG